MSTNPTHLALPNHPNYSSSSLEERERAYVGLPPISPIPKMTLDFASPIESGRSSPLSRFGANVFSLVLQYATWHSCDADPRRYWKGLAEFSQLAQLSLQSFVRGVCSRPEHWSRASAYKTDSVEFLQTLIARVATRVCPIFLCQQLQSAALSSFEFLHSRKGASVTLGEWVFCHLNIHDALFVPFQATHVMRLSLGGVASSTNSTALCRAYYDTAVALRQGHPQSGPVYTPPKLSLELLTAALESLGPLQRSLDKETDQGIMDLVSLASLPKRSHTRAPAPSPIMTPDTDSMADSDAETIDATDDDWDCKKERSRFKRSPARRGRKRMAASLDADVSSSVSQNKRAKLVQSTLSVITQDRMAECDPQSPNTPFHSRVKVIFMPTVAI